MTTSELRTIPFAATSQVDNQDHERRLAAVAGGAVLLVASVAGMHHLYRAGDELGELITWSVLLLGLFTALGGGIKLIMWGLRPVTTAASRAAKERLSEPIQAVFASLAVIAGALGMWWSFRGGYSAWWQQITGEAGWSLALGVGQMLVAILAGAALFTGGKYLFGLVREVVTGVDDAGTHRNQPQKKQDESLWHPGLVAALVGGGFGLVLLTAGITPRLYVWITGPQILPAVGAIAVVLLVAIGSNLGWWKGLTGLYKWATAASQKATAAAGVIAVLMFSASGLGLGWFTPATVPVARAACPPDCGGPGGSDGPPGGGQMFQPPSQGGPQMPDYQGGINQPPMDQNSSISIYNTQAPSISNNGAHGSSGQQGPQQGWDQPAHGTQPPDYQNATPYTQGPGRPNPDFNGGQTNPGNNAGSQGGQANQGAPQQQPPSQNNAGQQPPQNQPPQQNTEQPNQSDQQRLDELTRQLQEKQQQSTQDRQRIDDLTKQLQQGQQKQDGNQKLPRFPSKDDKKDRDQQDRDKQSGNNDLAALLMGAASTRRRKDNNQQQPDQQQQGPDTQALTQDGAQLGQSLPGDIANTVSDSTSLGQSAGSAAQNFGQAGQAGASLASSAQSGAVNPQDAITLVQGVSGGIKDTADAVKSGSQIASTWLENGSQGTKIASDVSPQTKQLQQFLDDGKQGADTVNKVADMTSQGAGAVNSVASMDPSQVKSVELMSGDATAMGSGFQQAPQFEAPMEPAPTPPPAPMPPAGRYADVPVGGNRADAVKFAERYAKGWGADEMYFNPQDYDCTNFVSYALREGGFKPADPFHINNHTEDQWFNTSLKLGSPSAAWDNAKGLLTYINNGYGKASGGPVGSVIGETTFNPSTAPWDPDQLSKMGMKPGDLIFYDFHTGEGVIHASMYVGKQQFVDMPGMGDAVDYHTNDVQHHSWALPHLDDSGNPTDVTYRFVRMQYPGE